MGIRQRIALLLGVMAIGLLLVAGVGILQIDRSYTAANFSNTNTIPALTALNKLAISIDDARFRVMRHVFFSPDAAKMTKVEQTIFAARDDALAALETYERLLLDDEGRRLYDTARGQFEEFTKAWGPVVAASTRNDKAQAQALIASLDKQGKALGDAIDALTAHTAQLGETAAARAKGVKGASVLVFALIAILCAGGAVFLGLHILRVLLRQLGGEPAYAAEIANKMARGELADVDLRAGDEGSLLASMRSMMEMFRAFVAAQRENAKQHEAGMIGHEISSEDFPGVYGQMADSINTLVKSHIAVKMRVVEVVERYAIGDLSVDMDRLPGQKAQITAAIDRVKASLQAVNGQIRGLVDSAAAGDFKARGDADRFQHEFKAMVEGLNRLMEVSDAGLSQVSRIFAALASGDLTQELEGRFQGTFAQLKEDSSTTVERLRDVVGQIQDAATEIDRAAKEIATGNQDLSGRTETQASSLEQTSSTMAELNDTVRQNAENARLANDLAQRSNDTVRRGGEAVERVVATMGDIQDSSSKISDIINVIDSIAFQTNILALNAAVEAARAGEQGRGFAVVAGEVRTLAQRSATAAREIKELIAQSAAKVDGGVKLVGEAGDAMKDVVSSFQQVASLVSQITAASREQSEGIGQVAQAVTQMDDVTQQNAALVEEAAAAAESLEEQTAELLRAVGRFRLANADAPVGVSKAPAPSAASPAAGPGTLTRLPRAHAATARQEDEWATF